METILKTVNMKKDALKSHERPVSEDCVNDPMRFFRRNYYSPGEMSRMRQMVRESGTTLILPYDQFMEHDNRHAEAESDSANPDYICELAACGGYNAVAIHYGLAKRYWTKLAGSVPLVLKINGKTSIPSQSNPLSVHTSYVEDAVALGAVAVGYTMYYGSSRQDVDLPQLASVRKECDRYGMPLIVWAYPRGEFVDAKGGKESSYMVESAVRMATEMGATVIKANLPVATGSIVDNDKVPSYYRSVEKELLALSVDEQRLQRAKRAVIAAQGTPVLFSGGSEIDDDDLTGNAQACVDAGCFGFIFGRNMWKRKTPAALALTRQFQQMLDKQ
ncbi:fructose-bisphosphate aldolase [Candidatus Peregrinibacteria bacterium]|nr:fructose-bisphosphate aldolase [Candidatus Peregrinibacteria bacterium]